MYSCPWRDCSFGTNNRTRFLHRIAGGAADKTHQHDLQTICKNDTIWMSHLDYVHGAVALAERERWPLLGLSVTRRSLNRLCKRFNNRTVKRLCCFVFGQLRTACESYATVDLNADDLHTPDATSEISLRGSAWFQNPEKNCPGTLLNNCSYDLWQRRYVVLWQ